MTEGNLYFVCVCVCVYSVPDFYINVIKWYRSKERSRDRDREPSRDQERVDSRDQGRDYDRRSRDRDRYHDRERGYDRDRDRDSDRSRSYDSRSRRRSRSRSRERSRDYDRHRYFLSRFILQVFLVYYCPCLIKSGARGFSSFLLLLMYFGSDLHAWVSLLDSVIGWLQFVGVFWSEVFTYNDMNIWLKMIVIFFSRWELQIITSSFRSTLKGCFFVWQSKVETSLSLPDIYLSSLNISILPEFAQVCVACMSWSVHHAVGLSILLDANPII